MIGLYRQFKSRYHLGKAVESDSYRVDTIKLSKLESDKKPLRSDIINYLLGTFDHDTVYLEIGVRNPSINFDKINAKTKYSVDPGIEFKQNPVDFKLTSDEFFSQLGKGIILDSKIKFDVIFIDGLHLAEQVYRDILNALNFLKDDGYIVMHDCNPPSEFHAREQTLYQYSPAGSFWNGTTWKAYYKARLSCPITAVCIDTDWGVGVLSKKAIFAKLSEDINPFFEFNVLHKYRNESLNLKSFESFQSDLTDFNSKKA